MLTAELQSQLKAYLARVTMPIELIASLDESKAAGEMRALLQTIGGLSDKITVRFDGVNARKPSFAIKRTGTDMSLQFAAIPLGHEFT